MKWIHKVVSVALAMMLLCTMPITNLTASAVTAVTIRSGETKTADIKTAGGEAVFRFTPSASGYYAFYSLANGLDPVCMLFDSDGELLAQNDDASDRDLNFRVKYFFEANQTYYYHISLFSERVGSFEVTLEPALAPESIRIYKAPKRTQYVAGFVNEYIDTEGLVLEVTWEDGSTTLWNTDESSELEGSLLELDYDADMEAERKVTIMYEGLQASYPITVAENTVKSIEAVGYAGEPLIENTTGFISTTWDYETDNEKQYFNYTYEPDRLIVKINYKDGRSQTVTGVTEPVNGYYIEYYDWQFETEWTRGGDNPIDFYYLGCETTYYMPIAENPVADIVMTSAPTYVYVYGDRFYGAVYDETYYFDPVEFGGLGFTVYFKDGSQKHYSGEDIAEDEIDGFPFDLDCDFEAGSTGNCPVTFRYRGHSFSYDVQLTESPVLKIEIVSPPSKVNCPNEYFYPDYSGMSLQITDRNNTVETVTLTGDDITFTGNLFLQQIYALVDINGYTALIETDWSAGVYGTTVYYLDQTATANGLIRSGDEELSPAEILSFHTDGNLRVRIASDADGETPRIYDLTPDYCLFCASGDVPFDAVYIAKTADGYILYEIYANPNNTYSVALLGGTVPYIPPHTPGDINNDGRVELADVVLLAQYVAEWDVAELCHPDALDPDGSGESELKDVVCLAQYVAQWEGIILH